ncbi:right-handed parallel beta-helix repeat-containing protein [Solibacillus sp. FSL K6-1554]|uniref:right-handed parallel beta-helix repeat-containing protein n=1 Tax=Solibacillus sp. FSL K6-1554 TaxID=2921472 RepID=UPI0030F59BF3
MKKFLLLGVVVIALFFFENNTYADTTVKGVLLGDQIWTEENSPYFVKGDLLIDSEATLSIEKGTKIYFSEGGTLNVSGKLLVNGTIDKPVIFDKAPDSIWYGISLNSDNNKIQYAEILSAGTGSSSTASINIWKSVGNIIDNNKIINGDYGIEVYGSTVNYKIPGNTISNNIIHNTFYGGIKITDGNQEKIMFNKVYEKNYFFGVSLVGKNFEVIGNEIFNNRLIGLSVGSNGSTIIGNKVYNNLGVGIVAGENLKYFYGNSMYNNVKDGKVIDLSLTGSYKSSIDVSNNYWGTIDIEKVKENIHGGLENTKPTAIIKSILKEEFDFNSNYLWLPVDNVTKDKQWKVTLSKSVDLSTLNTDNIYIIDYSNNKIVVEFDFDSSNNTITITPKENYTPGQKYSLVISNKLLSIDGDKLSEPIKKDFIVE